jgi:signal transduction histidine kinase
VGFDITASIRVQQALDLSQQSYQAITDNLSIGVALVDTKMDIKAGNIRLSQWFAENFRLDRRVCEILCCNDYKTQAAIRGPGYTCPECPFKASLADGAGHEVELAVTFADGKEHMMRLVTYPVKPTRSGNGKPGVRALIMMLEDITTRLKVNQQLQRARKLEAMSTLAGGIAHEINQPLSALHLYASGLQMLLEKQAELPLEVTQERLGLIMREAEKIRSIIAHMRALVTREGKVPLTAVSLSSAVRAVLGIMRNQLAGRGITVDVDIPDDTPRVRSNMVQLEQVLVNLLGNAVHALDSPRENGPGEKRILLRAVRRPRQVEESPRVRLEVADSGPGLPEGSERIFDPFYTTKERHEGMGLGLSIVYGLVTLWGGEISAAAHHVQLGGAVFYVDFHPADAEVAQREAEDIPMLEGVGGAL